MSGPSLYVGGAAVYVERYSMTGHKMIRVVTIVRETKTQWIDDMDRRWRKRDGAKMPQGAGGYRYLMSESEWAIVEAYS